MIRLTATWWIREGCQDKVIPALQAYTKKIECEELGTLKYVVHLPDFPPHAPDSRPVPMPLQLTFVEVYEDLTCKWTSFYRICSGLWSYVHPRP